MRRTTLLSLVLAATFIGMATAAVIHVPAQQSTIQGALYLANNGDTILVAAGTYSEHITFLGKNVVLKSESGPDVTIIQAANTNRPIIRFQEGGNYTATLDGFTVRNSRDSSAVLITNSGATLKNNIFTNNTTIRDGGAVNAINGDTLFVLNNIFRGNSSTGGWTGGALHALGMAMIIRGNEFRNNTAATGGAAWLGASAYASVDHNLMVGNISPLDQASAMFLSVLTGGGFYNNTVTQDTSRQTGTWSAAILASHCVNYAFYNNIIVNNIGSKGIFGYHSTNCVATYNDVWGNGTNYDSISPGSGSISVDPLFFGGSPYSYYLSGTSPCIDAGDPSSPNDPDGSQADMGAYYLGYGAGFGSIAGSVLDTLSNPFEEAEVSFLGAPCRDTTDITGSYFFRGMLPDRTYGIKFSHAGYIDSVITGITVSINDTTVIAPVQLRFFEHGWIEGTVQDIALFPIPNVRVAASGGSIEDTTDSNGHFVLGMLPSGHSCNILISRGSYYDTTLSNIPVIRDDTTHTGSITLRRDASEYFILGDINGNYDATPLSDIIYGYNYFRGGQMPSLPDVCGQPYIWVAGDVTNSCNFNGIDLIHLTRYWKGEDETLRSCSTCVEPAPDPMLQPSGPDPGLPDSIIVGNLNLAPITAHVGDTVSIPIWIKNDEPVPGINIPIAADTGCISSWIRGTVQTPLSGFSECNFLTAEQNQPLPGYSSQTILGWKIPNMPGYLLNTGGAYQQAATIKAIIGPNADLNCNTIQIIAGSHSRSGAVAFCDSSGTHEWSPAIRCGQINIVWNRTHISLSQASLVDTVICGNSASNPLYIANLGALNLNFWLGSGANWLSTVPSAGIISPGHSDTASIVLNAAALMPGMYTSQINITSNDSAHTVISLPVTLVVQSGLGSLSGTAVNLQQQPLSGVIVTVPQSGACDTTGASGLFVINMLPSCTNLTIHFSHPCYPDTAFTDIYVNTGNTTSMGTVRIAGPALGYVSGTVTGNTMAPLAGAIVRAVNTAFVDTTDDVGYYILSKIPTNRAYDIQFFKIAYGDTTVANFMASACDTVSLNMQLFGVPTGFIAGTVLDNLSNPLPGVRVVSSDILFQDTTDAQGQFRLNWIPSYINYSIAFHNNAFADTTIGNVFVATGDTTFMNPVQMRSVPPGYNYILGDANGDGDATPLADIAYMTTYFWGGPPPPYYNNCPADLNGNCNFNGIDIVYGVYYWMGGPAPHPCSTCAAPQPDPDLLPSDPDPGLPDGIIVGNLDLSPLIAFSGDTITIPIWVKTDEPVPALNISLAIDTTCISRWIGGSTASPISGWEFVSILTPEANRPMPGYSTQTLVAWRTYYADPACLNTHGAYQQVASFKAVVAEGAGSICNIAEIISGSHSRAGVTAFCDSVGLNEWTPAVIGGTILFSASTPHVNISRASFEEWIDTSRTITRNFTISNTGNANLHYQISWDSSWISVNPTEGNVSGSQMNSITLTLSSNNRGYGTYIGHINVASNDPFNLNSVIQVTMAVSGGGICGYVAGDANGSGLWTGQDVTYSVRYFKGGPPPVYSCECPSGSGHNWYVSGDVNGSCSFTGQDVTRMVLHFKTGVPAIPCPDCPPPGDRILLMKPNMLPALSSPGR